MRYLVVLPVLLLAACGATPAPAGDPALPQRPAGSVTVTTAAVAGLGRVLTDGSGNVLYMFPPDARRTVSCTGACAGTWPPLAAASSRAGGGVAAAKLGSLPDPNTGGRVITYNRYPLYRYAGDVRPGQARGQALNLNGGPWYVLNPAGAPLTRAVS